MSSSAAEAPRPGRHQARVVANRPAGAYRQLVLTAPGIGHGARPGQFVALAVGDQTSATLLRRAFSVFRVGTGKGPDGSQDELDVIVAAHGPGTRWLTSRGPGDEVDLIGPLGKAFPLPTEPIPCVLVGGGYGSAPLFGLAEALRQRGCRVDLILGAATAERLFGKDDAETFADRTVLTTEDGSAGVTGLVSDVLPDVLTDSRAVVVYACGPMPMLHAVSEIAERHGAVAQVAVEEAMACGVGVCMTCVMPVRDRRGVTSMVRSCLSGPVFRGDRVRWDAVADGRATVPEDCLGAPASSTEEG